MSDDEPVIAPHAVREAVLSRLNRRIRTRGEVSFPAAPSLLEVYVERLTQLFCSLGKALSEEESARLRAHLEPRLQEGFAASSHCRVHVEWEAEAWPGIGVDYRLWLEKATVQEQYEHWASSHEPPLFGAYPDAKVIEVAHALSTLGQGGSILDVGAGTGRNTLPLARAGFAVVAVEITESFAAALAVDASAEGLQVQVVRGSALDPEVLRGAGPFALVVCSEVTTHFQGRRELRRLFERAAEWLGSGGLLLMNAFVAADGYEPDEVAREMSQIVWSTLFTRGDLAAATEHLPFELVSDEAVYTFEQQHQPAEGWPPTGWFADWSRGYNCFGVNAGVPPMQLRWLLYRKG